MDSIYITKPYLPDRKKYDKYIDRIYSSSILTNNGPLVREFKSKLESYLGVENLLLVTNGTLALQIAYKALDLVGSVITTPFSFVATSSSLVWEGLNPVFVDIDKDTLNIAPERIEQAVTNEVNAIVPVHVFGNACDLVKIEAIADSNNLKTIYDASHAFNIKYQGQSLLKFGDASTLSFHATKVFHTIEGGAIIFKKREDYNKALNLINFGFNERGDIISNGINAKMNEFQAAMGLCILDEIDTVLYKREIVWNQYFKELSNNFELQNWESDNRNYGYFPIIFKDETQLKNTIVALESEKIYPRRYFYPSLNNIVVTEKKQTMPMSDNISKRILCLPVFTDLQYETQLKIIDIIKGSAS